MKQTLWTIQTEEAYQKFERSSILRANEDHLFCGDELRFAYDWLAQEMVKKIGAPPDRVRYPIWAWYQWEGQRKRMDLRRSGYAKRGTPLVQITFEADVGSYLLSDFDSWHIVLANQYVADNEADWDLFNNREPAPEHHEVELSWERIFDLSRYTPDWDCKPEEKSVQATLWQIEMSQVRKVEHFIAK